MPDGAADAGEGGPPPVHAPEAGGAEPTMLLSAGGAAPARRAAAGRGRTSAGHADVVAPSIVQPCFFM
jgi:hypothetical protein